jgi:hypothetical protein
MRDTYPVRVVTEQEGHRYDVFDSSNDENFLYLTLPGGTRVFNMDKVIHFFIGLPPVFDTIEDGEPEVEAPVEDDLHEYGEVTIP